MVDPMKVEEIPQFPPPCNIQQLQGLQGKDNFLCHTLYHQGVDNMFCCCLTLEEVESILNDCHSGVCGGHLSGLATTQMILQAGYFWLSIFKDCVEVVKKCHPC
jgi:hypothetical protein